MAHTINDLLYEIIPHLPGCGEPIMTMALKKALFEFCRDTELVQKTNSDILDDPIESIDLISDTGFLPLHIHLVAVNKRKLIKSEWMFHPEKSQIGFFSPVGRKNAKIKIVFSQIPDSDNVNIPDVVWNRYSEAISSNALYRLMVIAGKPWTNTEIAQIHLAKYYQLRADAKLNAISSFSPMDEYIDLSIGMEF